MIYHVSSFVVAPYCNQQGVAIGARVHWDQASGSASIFQVGCICFCWSEGPGCWSCWAILNELHRALLALVSLKPLFDEKAAHFLT